MEVVAMGGNDLPVRTALPAELMQALRVGAVHVVTIVFVVFDSRAIAAGTLLDPKWFQIFLVVVYHLDHLLPLLVKAWLAHSNPVLASVIIIPITMTLGANPTLAAAAFDGFHIIHFLDASNCLAPGAGVRPHLGSNNFVDFHITL